MNLKDGKIGIGKTSELTLSGECYSKKHCEIKPTGITDLKSTYGTYVHLRNLQEEKQAIQSDPVDIDTVKGEKIFISGYILAIK